MPQADMEAYKRDQDSSLKTIMERFGMPFSRIDLRILIYRPDKPIGAIEAQYADILIRNDQAVDKPYRKK